LLAGIALAFGSIGAGGRVPAEGGRGSPRDSRALRVQTRWQKHHGGEDGKPLSIQIPITSGIAGLVVTSGEPLNIADPYSHPNFNPEVDPGLEIILLERAHTGPP
jgi:hypothetical protein